MSAEATRAAAEVAVGIDLGTFRIAYRKAVAAVLPYFDRERLEKIAVHNPGWHPDRHAVGEYLRASEDRYVHVLELFARSGASARPRVLEVGGFFGAFPLALARLGLTVTLSEKYEYYYGAFDDLRALLEREGVDVWDEDLTQPIESLGRERFGLVTALAIVEHLASTPRPLMENLRDLLADDGKLLLEVPNIAYWPKRIQALLGESIHPPLRDVYDAAIPFTGHHREYTAAELRDLITWSGLHMQGFMTYNYTPEPARRGLSWLLRRWPARHLTHGREVLLACAARKSSG